MLLSNTILVFCFTFIIYLWLFFWFQSFFQLCLNWYFYSILSFIQCFCANWLFLSTVYIVINQALYWQWLWFVKYWIFWIVFCMQHVNKTHLQRVLKSIYVSKILYQENLKFFHQEKFMWFFIFNIFQSFLLTAY